MDIYNPRQTILVTCRGVHELLGVKKDKDDILPLQWHSPVSKSPKLYSIFIKKDLMGANLIRDSGVFVVNFMPYSLVDKIAIATGISGEFVHKCSVLGLSEKNCESVDCFRILEASGWLECEVVNEEELGDHIMFVGAVVQSHLNNYAPRPFHLSGTEYTTTK